MDAVSHQTLDDMSKASKIGSLKGMQMNEVAAYLSNQNQKMDHGDTTMPNTVPTSSDPHQMGGSISFRLLLLTCLMVVVSLNNC